MILRSISTELSFAFGRIMLLVSPCCSAHIPCNVHFFQFHGVASLENYVLYICFGVDFKRAKRCSLCVIASSLIYAKSMYEFLKSHCL